MNTETKVVTKSGLAVGIAIGAVGVALIAGASWAVIGGARISTTSNTNTVKSTSSVANAVTALVGKTGRITESTAIPGLPKPPAVGSSMIFQDAGSLTVTCPAPPCTQAYWYEGNTDKIKSISCVCPDTEGHLQQTWRLNFN